VPREERLIACALILLVCVLPCIIWKLDGFLELFQTIIIGMCLGLVAYKGYFLLPNDEGKLYLIGVILYFSSSLLVGTKGHIAGVKRVDIFHVMLVFANLAFTRGIMLQRNLIV